jgi:hypothetical protein
MTLYSSLEEPIVIDVSSIVENSDEYHYDKCTIISAVITFIIAIGILVYSALYLW